MKRGTKSKRSLSMLLALMMVLTLLPTTAFAAPEGVKINEANFPDNRFRKYVDTKFDTTDDDVLTAAEIAAVKEINIAGDGGDICNTLKGVEYFTALTELNCSNNSLSSLDVSKNTALTTLNCFNNQLASLDLGHNTALLYLNCGSYFLKSLDLSKNTALTNLFCPNSDLTSLDLSRNTALKELDCSWDQLTSLDLSRNTALTKLTCIGNKLTSLDLSRNTALKELDCSFIEQLTSLDVRNSTALTNLNCGFTQLTSLDVSKSTALTKLDCSSSSLSSLDMSKNTALKELDCGDNQLTSLDLSKNAALTKLYCNNNQLTSLDLSRNTALEFLNVYGNFRNITLSAGRTFDLSTLPGFVVNKASNFVGGTVSGNILTAAADEIVYHYDCGNGNTLNFKLLVAPSTVPPSGDVEINKTNFPDDAFRAYVDAKFDTTNDNILTAAEITAVKEIAVDNKKISTLKGVEYFTALTKLTCDGNQLTSLDLSHNTALKSLATGNNSRAITLSAEKTFDLSTLPGFDVKKAKNFVGGTVSGNILTAEADGITYDYDCGNNKTAKFKLVVAPLEDVEINKTNFPDDNFRKYVESFDTNDDGMLSSAERAIDSLSIPLASIGTLKGVEYFTALTDLDCSDNQLTSLDLSKNTALTRLECGNNYLTSLDLSNNTALKVLRCKSCTNLTSLDVSNNAVLTELDCGNTKLPSLDLSHNTALEKLDCSSTDNLISLDLSHNTALTTLDCGGTKLPSLDLSHNTALLYLDCSGTDLPSLDLSHNTALAKLNCSRSGNLLPNLDLSHNTALIELDCSNNGNLPSLDLSRNTALFYLDCSGNFLSSLDLSHNTALNKLDCSDNQLTSLDLSKSTALEELVCEYNPLSSLDLSRNTALKVLLLSHTNLTSLDVSKSMALEIFVADDNARAITLSAEKTFDLSTLPGFDVHKASNFVGGTVSGNILTATADKITYDYDCGNSNTANFKLIEAPVALAFADNVAYDVPAGKQDSTYTATTPLTATGGKAPYTFSIAPTNAGLYINNENKLVFTRPAEASATTATIKCRDATNNSKTITITVGAVSPTVVTSASATVTAPKAGAFPSTTATPGASNKYSVSSVSWKPSDSVFVNGKSYTVLVTLKAKDGLKFASSPVAAINEKTAIIVSGESSDEMKILYTFLQTGSAAMPFVDVPDDAYFKDAVVWAVDKGITTGISATTFGPNDICTRAHAVTFLWRAIGSPAPQTTAMPFNDVSADSYYYNAVLWAVEKGIIKGTSETTFSPNVNCSRAQIVTMQWRMADVKDATADNPFVDVSSSSYYADAVVWAVGRKVTEGTSATTFSPDDNCTRAQIVTFIYRDMK